VVKYNSDISAFIAFKSYPSNIPSNFFIELVGTNSFALGLSDGTISIYDENLSAI
jgi:hypothetical protein